MDVFSKIRQMPGFGVSVLWQCGVGYPVFIILQQRLFDFTFQLSDISRPTVFGKDVFRMLWDIKMAPFIFHAEPIGKIIDQNRDVLFSIPQRWHVDTEHIQPEVNYHRQRRFAKGLV